MKKNKRGIEILIANIDIMFLVSDSHFLIFLFFFSLIYTSFLQPGNF